ncbi:heat shock 70 kDa protein 12A-like [Mytilus edulis]|uniref:heat shock 70 kDa protein 12A-like n=1 Tax=Mytilus edulis TaxID=6550 RepID=UPI0039EE6191
MATADGSSVTTSPGDTTLMVVALDFGTTYSGYAFSFRKNPHMIFANQQWDSGKYHLNSYKTPTCVVIRKDNPEEFYFGYDAENEYAEIQTDNETDNYFFFDRFKMQLHLRKDVSEGMMIHDIRGGKLPAIDVFSTAIRALKDHALKHVEKGGNHIKLEEIKWVLTVPAIWTDKAKTFMRLSAEKAGISGDRLGIALEPEAASIYCQHIYRKMDDELGAITGPVIVKQGASYLVVDIGGGTLDITAHQKEIHNKVRELCKPSGAAYGGTAVDRAFMEIFEKIVGPTVIETLKKEYTSNYFDLVRGFEMLKRKIGNQKSSRPKINFQIPFAALDTLCKRFKEKSFPQTLVDSECKDSLTLVSDKLQMDKELVKDLFKNTTNHIIEEIKMTLREAEPADVTHFLLVGGFSESDIVQNAIKGAFPDKEIIIPDDPTLAVVRGAVLFGHTPDFVSSRFTRYAYGRRIRPKFDESKHDKKRSVKTNGLFRCKDVFDLFMKKDTFCSVGTVCKCQYHTFEEMQKKITIAVYVSDHDDTKYVDDEGCEKLGELVVDIPNPTRERRLVDVEYHFGGTELTVTARVIGTQDVLKAGFQLI